MTAQYYEAIATVPTDHCLRLPFPPEIPAGAVRVAIIFEAEPHSQATGQEHDLIPMSATTSPVRPWR